MHEGIQTCKKSNFLEKCLLHECHVPNFLWVDPIIRMSLRSHLGESRISDRTKRDPRKAVPQRVSGGYLPTPHPRALQQNEIYHRQPTQNPNTKESTRSRTKQKLHMQHAAGSSGNSLSDLLLPENFLWPLHLCALKQKVMLGVSPLVLLKEIPVKL